MSRPALLTLAAVVAATPARAQDANAWRDSVVRVSAEIRALRDSLLNRDSNTSELARRDGLVISASPSQRQQAVDAFEYFLSARTRWFGGSLPSADGFRIVIRTSPPRQVTRRLGYLADRAEGVIILSGLPDSAELARVETLQPYGKPNERLLHAFADLMFSSLPPRLQLWLTYAPPVHLAEPERRSLTMYAVMTATGQAERGCVAGRIHYCAYALGLRVAPSPELTGSFPPLIRADLLATALDLGGEGAWSRFAGTDSGGVAAALVRAAGVAADSLLVVWRSGLVGLKPDRPLMDARGMLLVAGWAAVVLVGTLGLARWR